MKRMIIALVFVAALICASRAQMLQAIIGGGSLPAPNLFWRLCGDTSSSSGCTPSSSSVAYDASGNGYTGTLNGTQAGTTDWYVAASGRTSIPYALFLNGTNDYVTASSSFSSTGRDVPLSLCAWVYPAASPAGVIFGELSKTSTAWNGWFLQYSAPNIGLEAVANTTFSATPVSKAYTASAWNFICGVYPSNASRTIYVNGVQGSTDSSTVAVNPISNSLAMYLDVGASVRLGATIDNYANGDINDVQQFSSALTAAQISSLYSSQAVLFYPDIRRLLKGFSEEEQAWWNQKNLDDRALGLLAHG